MMEGGLLGQFCDYIYILLLFLQEYDELRIIKRFLNWSRLFHMIQLQGTGTLEHDLFNILLQGLASD